MRLGDLDALKKKIQGVVENEIPIDEKWAIGLRYSLKLIDNAPTVELKPFANIIIDEEKMEKMKEYVEQAKAEILAEYKIERPQGEWVRKEDIIHYIATQYSEHNELVPIWLSIGDLKGGADMRGTSNE